MKRTLVAIVPLLLLAAACGSGSSPAEDLIVQNGDSIEVHYVLTLEDGTEAQSSRDTGSPLPFVVGSGQVIPGFDAAVLGSKVGDVINVTLQPKDAYGEHDPSLLLDVPIAEGQEDVAVGDIVFLTNGQRVVVMDITDGVATVDMNHELAGKVLNFEVEIVSIARDQ